MNKYFYDFHIHSCLSPCADNDNTPNNIAGMGSLAGLNMMALTDHNTTKNCPAFFTAAKKFGIIPVAGMELTTAEDIHIIFLLPTLESAAEFDEYVTNKRILIENRPDIFGEQLIMDGQDNVIGEDKFLLSNATEITVDECPSLAEKFGGISYPAHIDRESNGIISALGTFPDIKGFKCAEFRDGNNIDTYREKYPIGDRTAIVSSDAHYIWEIRDKEYYFSLDDEPYSSDFVRRQLFKKLKGNI